MEQIRKSIVRSLGALGAAIALFAATGSAAADEKPFGMTLTFGPRAVTVDGVEGTHPIVTIGIGIGSHGYAALLRREVHTAVDEDGDGRVVFEVRDVPARSVWVTVDGSSGRYVIATPSGEAPGVLSVPADAWRSSHDHADLPGTYLELLVVRPGAGAWTLRTADGGANDSDGVSDRKVRLRPDRMEKLIGEDQGPAQALPKDLLVAIDPQTLEVFVSEAR